LCVSEVTVQNNAASSPYQLARCVAKARRGSHAEPPRRRPTKYSPNTMSKTPTTAIGLGSSCRKNAPPIIVNNGMNPMIGCTTETSPRLNASERQSIPPISFGMTTATARQYVGVSACHASARRHDSRRITPATTRNATVETTTPATLTARLSRRLVAAEAQAARRARTIHIEHQRKRGGGREGTSPPPRFHCAVREP